MSGLAGKIVDLHAALDAAGLPHAFGGALALAWCTREPRGTSDIDVNVFVPTTRARDVVGLLPAEIVATGENIAELESTGQSRLFWDRTPVDIFLSTTPFHDDVLARAALEPFEGRQIPFLRCTDLAVFKAFFDRRRDWADLEAMLLAGSVDVPAVTAVLAGYLGPDDHRLGTLAALVAEVDGGLAAG